MLKKVAEQAFFSDNDKDTYNFKKAD